MSELWRLGAAEISTRVARAEISALEVTESCLARRQAVNPGINAVVAQMPDEAIAAGKAIDLSGKTALVLGVANQRSLAWAIAESLGEGGAQLAFTYQGERLQKNVVSTRNARNFPFASSASSASWTS